MPPIEIIKRCPAGLAMLALASSCAPQGDRYRVEVEVPRAPVTGHRLLRLLALDDPLGRPAPPAAAAPAANTPAPPFLIDAAADSAGRAAQCLTAAVYYEARSEPLDGQRAVAQVVLNRVRDRAFPNSICKVVYQHPANRPGCQFSFACDGSTGKPIDRRAWDMASGVAQAALAGQVYAPIGSATYYHTAAVLPWWSGSLTRIGLVGSHIFYRWGNTLGRALSFRQAYSGDETLSPFARAQAPSAGTVVVAAGDGGPRIEAGVVVHRSAALPAGEAGGDVAGETGVVVHRASVASAGRPGLVRTSFGVRIHYSTPGTAADPPAAADAAETPSS